MRCCQLKADVVEKDEREETGLRMVLNYGHTFAHAFETVSGYGTWLHGEAVAAGMVCASRLAEQRGWTPKEVEAREKAQLPLTDKVSRADYAVDNSGPGPSKPAFLQPSVKRRWIASAMFPSPDMRVPNRLSFSLPRRRERMRLSTFAFFSGKCCVSHCSNNVLTAWQRVRCHCSHSSERFFLKSESTNRMAVTVLLKP